MRREFWFGSLVCRLLVHGLLVLVRLFRFACLGFARFAYTGIDSKSLTTQRISIFGQGLWLGGKWYTCSGKIRVYSLAKDIGSLRETDETECPNTLQLQMLKKRGRK